MHTTTQKYYSVIQLIIVILFGISISVFSSEVLPEEVEFNHITIKEGLANNRVDCMLQDYEGYLWFGTKRGLCKYNGYEFTTYKSQSGDTTSLRYHQISDLWEDTNNTLWIGTTGGGLHYYNREKDCFHYVDVMPESFSPMPPGSITSIRGLIKDEVLVIHSQGVSRININTKAVISYKNINSSEELPGYVSAVHKKHSGNYLIAIQNEQLLYYYDFTDDKVKDYQWHSKSEITPQVINQFYQFDNDNLWLATDKGLFNLNTKTHELTSLNINHSLIISADLKFIIDDFKGNIWFGGEGLFVYSKKNVEFKQIQNNPDDQKSIEGNIITCGLRDNQKNLWFGTFSRGINVTYHKTKFFNSNRKLTGMIESLSKNITAIYKSNDGHLLLGTWDKGLFIIDNNNNLIDIDKTFPRLKFLKHKIIRTIASDKDENIWVGTNDGMLVKLNQKKKLVETYQYDKLDDNNGLTSILFTDDNQMWIGGNTGIFVFNSNSNTISEKKFNNIAIPTVLGMSEDNDGNIWIASYSMGLLRISKDEKLTHFSNNSYKIPKDRFVTVFKDSRGRIWAGTEFNGLFIYNPDSDNFQQFTIKQGLPSNDICSIQEDYKGRLWIGTNNGLSRFNYSLNDFNNYFWSDGMNADEFHYNSNYTGIDNLQYFGCTNGVVIFDPDEIRDNYITFPVKIEEISINNGSVLEDAEGISILEALRKKIPLKLNYNQNTISFKYTTLNYSPERKSDFAYKLEGFDEQYHNVDNQRQITYTNLPPGEYVFHVIASNNDNIWDKKGSRFSFIIQTPPWFKWWAWITYIALIALIIFAIRRQIRHEEKMKNAIEMERVEKSRQKEINQMKLRFFTNISHEFKTPLTLIIGPLEQLIAEQHGNSKLKQKLSQISLNSIRLLELINQLIDFRKIEHDALPLRKSNNDLIYTVQKIMNMFVNSASKNEINFNLNTNFKELTFNYDSDKIEKVLNNILSNAFKYTDKDGNINVTLALYKETDVSIEISDTGKGMSPDKLDKIFDRFYGDGDYSDGDFEIHSSGIGLAYAKKLIELHSGVIAIESNEGKGTTVTIKIPYDNTSIETDEHTIQQQVTNENIALEQEPEVTESNETIDLSNAPKILIVEDDNELRAYIKSVLKDYYHVDEAVNGQDGYDQSLKDNYELIVSDVMMPQVSGTAMCEKLKSNIKTSHIPVILLTAKSDTMSELEGYKTGADSYIGKPFSPEKLKSVIANLLKTRQRIKEYYSSAKEGKKEPIGLSPKDKELVSKATKFIEDKLNNEDLGVEALGREMGLSRTHLYRKLKSLTGLSPNEFIRQIKLKKAAQLLTGSHLNISEIAMEIGFNSTANFSTSFKSFYGMSPKEYRTIKQG